jgi:drug/metabolite transporter (DMT)-like permease
MLVNTGPILIALLAGVLLREGFPRKLLLGCAVAFSGVVLIGAATSNGVAPSWGALLCLLAAVLYAGGVVAQKPALARVSPLMVTWVACTVGTILCLPFASSLWHDAAAAPASSLGWVVYLGIAPSAIGFIAWAFALSRTTAGRMGSTTYLVPPIAILLGLALLGEVPPLLAVAGGALCLAGVAVARR